MSAAGNWTQERVGEHDCDVYTPPTLNEHGYVVIYLHGVHQTRLADRPAFTAHFDTHNLPVIAPQGGRSWWSNKICQEFDPQQTAERHLLDDVMPFAEQRFSSKPPQVGLLGTSMGGQGALRFSYKHPTVFPVVAALAPAIDYQLRFDEDEALQAMYEDPEAVRQDTALLHIHPLNWPRHQFFACDPTDSRWWDSADRLRMKLWSLGVPHECDLESSGGGHSFDYYEKMAPQAIGFIADRLEQERLRC